MAGDGATFVYAVIMASLLAGVGIRRRWLTIPAAITAWPVGLVTVMAGNEFVRMLLVRGLGIRIAPLIALDRPFDCPRPSPPPPHHHPTTHARRH